MSQQHVKEMFLIPKETFFNCMASGNASQQDRMSEVNVEQLNVSCGPLFAGLKNAKLPKLSSETTEMHSPEKKSADDNHDSASVQLQNVRDKRHVKGIAKEMHTKPKVLMPEKNPIVNVEALTGKLMDTTNANSAKSLVKPLTPHVSHEDKKLANTSFEIPARDREEKKKKKKKSASTSNPQGAEENIMQRILGNLGKDKRQTKSMDNSALVENDFEPVDIELEQNFKSDFARSLSEKKKVHPEIRLNSTRISVDSNEDGANTLASEKNVGGEDDVFLAETQELNPQGAESLVERALNRQSMPKDLARLFNMDFSRDDAPAEEQVNSSIEKTLATKNQQEQGEIERSRKSTSNPIKVSDLAGRFEKKQSSSERLEIPRETGTKKKKKKGLPADSFYGGKQKKSPPRARTRSEKAKEAHEKRKEKIAQGVDLPLFESPKRKRYVGM